MTNEFDRENPQPPYDSLLPADIIKTDPVKFYIKPDVRAILEKFIGSVMPAYVTPYDAATYFLERNRASWPDQLRLFKLINIFPVSSTPVFGGSPVTVLEAKQNPDMHYSFVIDYEQSIDPQSGGSLWPDIWP